MPFLLKTIYTLLKTTPCFIFFRFWGHLNPYFLGIWGIGVATQKVNLNQIPLGRDAHSLVMRNDGALYHNNEEKNRLPANSLPQEGDVVVSFLVELLSTVNYST